MPQNLALLDSFNFKGEYELNVYVNKESFKSDYLDIVQILKKSAEENKNIVVINLQGSFFDLEASDLKLLFEEIKKHKILVLDLTQVSGMGLGYTKNPNLREIFDLMVDLFRAGFLGKLNLSRNGIGNAVKEQQEEIIKGLLRIVPYIKDLDLSDNNLELLSLENLKCLFEEMSKSRFLEYLTLDGLDFFHYDEDLIDTTIGLELLKILMSKETNSGKKWQELAIRNTNIQRLEPEAMEKWLMLLNHGCLGVDLSYNQLQSVTNEQFFLDEDGDIIDKLASWISATELKKICLENNGFSLRHVKKLSDAASLHSDLTLAILQGNDHRESATTHQANPSMLTQLYVKKSNEEFKVEKEVEKKESLIERFLQCFKKHGLISEENIKTTDLSTTEQVAIKNEILLIVQQEEKNESLSMTKY